MNNTLPAPDYDAILRQLSADTLPYRALGKVADYIPALADVPANKFGIAIETVDGRRFQIGDADERFSIQSISKLFTLIMAFQRLGDELWQRVGREPSGDPFNSLVQLEFEHGIPRTPFINAGALVVTDVVCSQFPQTERAILDFVRRLAGTRSITTNDRVARSEAAHGFRNAAAANLIKSFGNLASPVEQVLDSYFRQCAIEMSCVELARAVLPLANGGRVETDGSQLLTASATKRINSLLLTCGTYDAAGEFAFRVGLPGKSGVGGGIVAVLPVELAICVWSPGLDATGNSLAGIEVLERFTTLLGRSIF